MASAAPDGRPPCSVCGKRNPPGSRFCGGCGQRLGPLLPRAGDIIADRYRVIERIGEGAMGTVYRAEHVQIGKAVAVKLLHHEVEQNAESVARFHREAEAASRLNHPNTVHVFDFGRTDSGSLYLVMEYVEGRDLGKILGGEGAMPFGRVAYLCAQVAGSVADAHAAGVIHRDLKPENIVVADGRDGEHPKVLDFGLAKLFEGTIEAQVTSSGTIVGTPYYMSPEQIQAQEVDGRSDVYAIGAIMYECVVGKPPFEAANPVGVLSRHLSEVPAPPSTRSPLSVPAEADEIILRCLAKDPDRRYQSAEDLRQTLIGYLTSVGTSDWRMSTASGSASRSGTRRVDELDSSLRKKHRPWLWFSLLALAAAGVVVWQLVTTGPLEREPNHLREDATRLLPNTDAKAFLGQRLSEDSGDVDLFEIVSTGTAPRAVQIQATSIPNMDSVVELLSAEGDEPFLVADSRGLGLGERVPNAPLGPGSHFIRVRAKTPEGELPTENVSDPYYVRWSPLQLDPGFEREPNDTLELAEPLALGEERRAWLGWSGDTDTFCLSEDADRVIAQVSALAQVDIVLRIVDSSAQRSVKVDDKGIGRGETSRPWATAMAGKLCLEISVDPMEEKSLVAQPDETYGVRWIAAPGR